MKIYLVKIWDLTESKKIVGDMPGISIYILCIKQSIFYFCGIFKRDLCCTQK